MTRMKREMGTIQWKMKSRKKVRMLMMKVELMPHTKRHSKRDLLGRMMCSSR
uniref:Uncharacterized protein n=1 Tax=Parascaris equorum TaxID=6256 RepID=A0A914R2A6_PAREQ